LQEVVDLEYEIGWQIRLNLWFRPIQFMIS